MKIAFIALLSIFISGCMDGGWSGKKTNEADISDKYGELIRKMSEMVGGGFSDRGQRLASERQIQESPRPQGVIEASYKLPSGGWQGIWSDGIKNKLVFDENWGEDLDISPVRIWHGDSNDGPHVDALRVRRSIMVDGDEWVIELIIESDVAGDRSPSPE